MIPAEPRVEFRYADSLGPPEDVRFKKRLCTLMLKGILLYRQ
jgi:hypothetical protein